MNEKFDLTNNLLDSVIEAMEYIGSNPENDIKYVLIQDSYEAVKAIDEICKNIPRTFSKIQPLINSLKQAIEEIASNLNKLKKLMKLCLKTREIILKLQNNISNEHNRKIQVVFLPYNASMWNCLESVWKCASEDSNCECHVVPIPYFKFTNVKIDNKTKMRTVTEWEMCYEGDLLPDNIPVEDYKTFSLEKLRPDIIYVHNQYDDCNTATRVLPKYFSNNLKLNCSCLVYIPYGIYGNYPIDYYLDTLSFIETRPFDKIIMQSYGFEKLALKAGISKEKLIVAGSPKYDAFLNSANTNANIIPVWKQKLSNKKIFVWTTNLMKVINSRNKAIDQIEELFLLIESDSNCGLIFRPHPLELSYIKLEAPECYKRYVQLMEWAEKSEHIILDKTSNYYVAFHLSDAMITDRSSVLIEYMGTGKPILVYDIGMDRKNYSSEIFDIFANYVVGEDGMTPQNFVEMVCLGEDPRYEERKLAHKNVLSITDGTSGTYIHENIIMPYNL